MDDRRIGAADSWGSDGLAIVEVDAQIRIMIVGIVDATKGFFEVCRGASVKNPCSSSSKITIGLWFELCIGGVEYFILNRSHIVIESDFINTSVGNLILVGINGIIIKRLKTLSV